MNHTDPSGFSADVDLGGGIVGGIVGEGHLAAPALMAAGLGANLGTAAIGGLAGGINIGVSALLGYPGAGSAPKTFTTPGGTHAPGAVGGAGSNALAQHSEIPQGSAKVQEGNSQLYYPPQPVPGDISPDEPIADAHVRSEMARALADSHPSATPENGSTEQGGWVLKRRGGGYDVIRWPTNGASHNGIPVPPRPPGRTVAASFHVQSRPGPQLSGRRK